jgi:hypothetical protein
MSITVVLRGHALLFWPAHHPRRLQDGFEIRPEDYRGAAQDIAKARYSGTGTNSHQIQSINAPY